MKLRLTLFCVESTPVEFGAMDASILMELRSCVYWKFLFLNLKKLVFIWSYTSLLLHHKQTLLFMFVLTLSSYYVTLLALFQISSRTLHNSLETFCTVWCSRRYASLKDGWFYFFWRAQQLHFLNNILSYLSHNPQYYFSFYGTAYKGYPKMAQSIFWFCFNPWPNLSPRANQCRSDFLASCGRWG